MKIKILKLMFAGILSLAMFTGCSSLSEDTIIPSDIINNALSAYEKSQSYYSEGSLTVYEKGELVEESITKEWTDSSEGMLKKRFESESEDSGKIISTNDGKELVLYMEKDNKAMKMDIENAIDESMGDYKEQFLKGLSVISKSHELSYVGEEKVNDFNTIHLHAKSKKENSMIGDIDYWIDKDTWFLVKTSSETGDGKLDMTYTKLEFVDKFDDSLFVQNIPEGVEIENLDENSDFEESEISIEEAEKIAGKPILVLENDDEYTLKNISSMSYDDLNRTEINQNYEKNGVITFILTAIIDGEKTSDDLEDEDSSLPGEEKAIIRGNEGSVIEDIINLINWEEEGIGYSLLVLDPSINMEKAKEIVENLSHPMI